MKNVTKHFIFLCILGIIYSSIYYTLIIFKIDIEFNYFFIAPLFLILTIPTIIYSIYILKSFYLVEDKKTIIAILKEFPRSLLVFNTILLIATFILNSLDIWQFKYISFDTGYLSLIQLYFLNISFLFFSYINKNLNRLLICSYCKVIYINSKYCVYCGEVTEYKNIVNGVYSLITNSLRKIFYSKNIIRKCPNGHGPNYAGNYCRICGEKISD